MKRTVDIQISGRKEPGYPTLSFSINFTTAQDLVEKIDNIIETETDFGKVDVSIDDYDEVLNESEIDFLGKNWIYVS